MGSGEQNKVLDTAREKQRHTRPELQLFVGMQAKLQTEFRIQRPNALLQCFQHFLFDRLIRKLPHCVPLFDCFPNRHIAFPQISL